MAAHHWRTAGASSNAGREGMGAKRRTSGTSSNAGRPGMSAGNNGECSAPAYPGTERASAGKHEAHRQQHAQVPTSTGRADRSQLRRVRRISARAAQRRRAPSRKYQAQGASNAEQHLELMRHTCAAASLTRTVISLLSSDQSRLAQPMSGWQQHANPDKSSKTFEKQDEWHG